MQQEQITLESVELLEIQEQVAAVSRGPMQLRPEILAWVSGGVSSELLPNATW